MRSITRWGGAAAVGSAALLLAACGVVAGDSDEPGGTIGDVPVTGVPLPSGVLLLSDGTSTVVIDGAAVTFPTAVTDAVWSPDGSRIAFIDGDGNVASARPDGSDLVVHTSTSSATRSHPTWSGAWIIFVAADATGHSTLMRVPANASGEEEFPHDTGEGTGYVDLNPSSRVVDRTRDYFVFQHDEPTGSEVWIIDDNRRTTYEGKLLNGSEPALSPDGSRLAFIDPAGAIAVVALPEFVTSTSPLEAQPVAAGAQSPHDLAWTPDGAHLVFATDTDVELVAADPAATPVPLATSPAVPSVLASKRDTVVRITGADAIDVAIAASRAVFPTSDHFAPSEGYRGVWEAEITSTDNVGAITPHRGEPLLLTGASSLDARTQAEIDRLFGSGGFSGGGSGPQLTVVGGAAVLPATVTAPLAARGFLIEARTTPPENYGGLTDGPMAEPYEVIIVDAAASPAEKRIARTISSAGRPVIEVDTAQPLEATLRAWLSHSSASVNRVLLVGPVGDAFATEVGGLVSGPLGFDTATNPDPVHL